MIQITFNADGRKLRTEERKIVNEYLDERDGLGCKAEDGKPCAGPILIHHVDNNPRHNPQDGSNWKHLCQGHNHRAHPRGSSHYRANSLTPQKKSTPLLSFSLKRGQRQLKSPMMVKSEAADRFFRSFISKHVTEGIEIHADDLLNGARNEFTETSHISVDQSTFEKVLDAVTSKLNGSYEMDEDTNMVRLRKKATRGEE